MQHHLHGSISTHASECNIQPYTQMYTSFHWDSLPFQSPVVFTRIHIHICGPGSSVGIVTELRVGRSGIESRWGRDFPPVQTGSGVQPASCKMGTGSFTGVKCGRVVLLTTHPLLVLRSWKSRAIPLPTLYAT